MSAIDNSDAAIEYAKCGWPIFPLHPISKSRCGCGRKECDDAGKHPAVIRWQNAVPFRPRGRSEGLVWARC